MADFDGVTFEPDLDEERLTQQLGRVRLLCLDGQWRTLDEIGAAIGAPPASVSARLRDLRKARFGGYRVERQRRGLPRNGLFEYRVLSPDPDATLETTPEDPFADVALAPLRPESDDRVLGAAREYRDISRESGDDDEIRAALERLRLAALDLEG